MRQAMEDFMGDAPHSELVEFCEPRHYWILDCN
jgi:hypothetical protein